MKNKCSKKPNKVHNFFFQLSEAETSLTTTHFCTWMRVPGQWAALSHEFSDDRMADLITFSLQFCSQVHRTFWLILACYESSPLCTSQQCNFNTRYMKLKDCAIKACLWVSVCVISLYPFQIHNIGTTLVPPPHTHTHRGSSKCL